MLPKIEQPYFTTTLPMSGESIRYRPYLMKEQKIILLALSGKETEDIKVSLSQIISNCTDGTVDASSLNAIDIGFLMVKFRSVAEGSVVDLNMHCKNIVEVKDEETGDIHKEECGHLTPMEVDLNNMEISGEIDEKLSKIDLGSGVGIKLKMPGLGMFDLINSDSNDVLEVLPILIDFIYNGEGEIFKLKNESDKSIQSFFDQLNSKNIEDISKYFKSLPKLVVKIPFRCEKCGHEEVVEIEDIQSFLV